MKIDIIHPAHYRHDGSLVQSKKWYDRIGAYLPHLGPALMAGLTPDRHDVRLVDEYVEDIDFESDADVVALSGQIMQYDRCFDISRKFRAAGKKVILGGYLPSMLPDEVEGLFDAIVVGEGDEAWPQILNDIELGQFKPRYKSARGCLFTCQYCSIAAVYEGRYRKRPVDQIVRDVEATGSRNINFCDDNLCEDVKFSGKLFTALKGAPIRWGTQTTINVARHPELLKQARESGCVLMALGVETFSARNLRDVNKTFHAVDKYAESFQRRCCWRATRIRRLKLRKVSASHCCLRDIVSRLDRWAVLCD